MDSNFSGPADPIFSAGQAPHQLCYIEPALTIDVMFDQLEYLLDHTSQECASGCDDCSRLKQIEALLLQPFRHPGQV